MVGCESRKKNRGDVFRVKSKSKKGGKQKMSKKIEIYVTVTVMDEAVELVRSRIKDAIYREIEKNGTIEKFGVK